jgi:hypothetical protein
MDAIDRSTTFAERLDAAAHLDALGSHDEAERVPADRAG